MTRLVSGRIQKTPSANVSAERYQFIEISEVEPDLGLPSALGQVFTSDLNGTRYWINLDTANTNETSNLYFTNARVVSAVTPLLTTANVIETDNLYYTNARVLSHLSQSDVETRNLTVYGNLNVVGNLTTISASTLEITDPLIKIAANNETSDAVDFGWLGHYSPDSGATRQHAGVFRKHNTDNFYIFSEYVDEELDSGNLVSNLNPEDPTFKLADVYGNVFHGRISTLENHTTDALVEGTNLYYTNTRVVSAVTPLLTTANVFELSSNLYYTNARVLAFVETLSISDLRDVSNIYDANVQGLRGIQTGQALVWDGNINQFVPVFVNSEIGNVADLSVRVLSLENFTTANITEASSNLYFTNTRVLSAVTPLLTTANVTELDNLYYTDARVLANVSQMSANVLADIDMTDISIGQILVWDGNKFIPGASDTSLFSETANSALFANTVGSLEGLTTDNLVEGSSNLYFTLPRAREAYTAGLGIAISEVGVISAKGEDVYDDTDLSVGQLVSNVYANLATFSAVEGNSFIVYSLHATNITGNTVYLNGRYIIDNKNDANTVLFANLFEIPGNTSLELLRKPQVFKPDDQIQLLSYSDPRQPANNLISVYMSYEASEDTFYKRVAKTITNNQLTEVFTTPAQTSIIESMVLNNLGPNVIPVTTFITDESDNVVSYLTSNLSVPARTSVEICEYPKAIPENYKIKVNKFGSVNDQLSVFITSKIKTNYVITPSANTISEGDSITFNIGTLKIGNGTILYYTLEEVSGNITQDDFVTPISGNVTIRNDAAVLTLQSNADASSFTEGPDIFRLQLRKGSTLGRIVATGSNVTILDTSNTITYGLVESVDAFTYTENVTFVLNPTNLPSNTVLYYNTSGNVISTDFVEGNTGSVVVVNATANITFTSNASYLAEGETRVFTLQLLDDEIDGNVLFSSNTITITGPPPPSPYIATPTATPAAFGDALEGGFYTGLIWNQVTQSDTSTTIGTGEKTFTVTDAAPLFYVGQAVEIRSRANPSTNRMIGAVTGASATTVTVNVTSVDGSGTLTDWSVMAKYRVIVAPKSSGENSSKKYKNVSTAAPAACGTLTEGLKATLAMVADGSSTVYPAAHFCNDLSIGGYSDWYLPARDELELIYRNLKPYTNNNFTSSRPNGAVPNYTNLGSIGTGSTSQGVNYNSDPQGAAYTTTVPGQTSVAAFQTGGAEAMGSLPWSSTEYSTETAWLQFFSTSLPGYQNRNTKTDSSNVRAVRRSII